MKKRILSILLCVSMVAAMMIGCASNDTAEEKDREIFVEAEWVKSVIDGEEELDNYVLAEVSWGSYEWAEGYQAGHIPGAIHINSDTVEYDDCDPWPEGNGIDDLAEYDKDFNYGANEVAPIDNFNIRSAEQLTACMKHFGITEDTTVILYGANATNSAVTRVAFAMLYAGVDHVKVLNGGYEAWVAAGYEAETTVNMPVSTEEDFGVKIPEHPEYIMSIEDVKDNLENNDKFNLVSIRSYDEFIGKVSGYDYITMCGEPEGAIWGKDTDDGTYAVDGKMVDVSVLKGFIEENGGSYDNELSFYCGTGWRATIPFLLAYEDGKEDISLYDGGWWQWTVKHTEDAEAYPIQTITPEEAAQK